MKKYKGEYLQGILKFILMYFQGIFAGWVDPEPTFKTALDDLQQYIFDNMLPKETKMEKVYLKVYSFKLFLHFFLDFTCEQLHAL